MAKFSGGLTVLIETPSARSSSSAVLFQRQQLLLLTPFLVHLFHVGQEYRPQKTGQTDSNDSISFWYERKVEGLEDWPETQPRLVSGPELDLHLVFCPFHGIGLHQLQSEEEADHGRGSIGDLLDQRFLNCILYRNTSNG